MICQEDGTLRVFTMRPSRPTPLPLSTVVLALGLALAAVPPAAFGQDTADGEGIDFLRDIRPILASHCFKCHGPDEKTRKGGLRLDDPEEALKPARSEARAIVPGRPGDSELLRRIDTSDPDELMPPPSAKIPLTDTQKVLLRRWIAAGAEYRPHWAFLPPQRPAVPALRQLAAERRTDLDAFILARLERAGLAPSPEADRLTLLRRVSLDLVGLPPTPEEADAFLADTSPEAYERVVDRLLASPHYGERWARRWMDLARYADTNGYEKDRPRSIWPWRDWLIGAINDDLPFDQFTIDQIAGDLRPGATQAQRIATGFHRNTMINEEGGIDPLEYRFHAMVDRVHTTATTWLGLTLACAQCHTHKYDPVTHREYYGFMAFLDNADEPEMEVRSEAIAVRRAAIEAEADALERDLPRQFPPEEYPVLITPAAERVDVASGAVAIRLEDGSYRLGGDIPERDTYSFVFDTGLTNVTGLLLEALADDALPSKGPGRADNGNFVLSEVTVAARPRGGAGEATAIEIARATADFEQGGYPIRHAVDGKRETGWAISGDGAWNLNRRASFRFARPTGFPGGTRFEVTLRQDHGGRHVLGRVRLSFQEEIPDPRPLEERRREHLTKKLEAWARAEAGRVVSWTALRPVAATSTVPVLSLEDDHAVFASSDQTKSDVYHLKFETELRGITALRVEALPDERLPRGGPGRVYYEGPIGDFFLSTLSVSAGGERVRLVRPSQTFASGGNDAAKALDDDAQSGWSINGGQGRRQVAVFNFEQPLDAGAFELTMLFEKYYAAGLGRFRISVTTDHRGAEASPLSDALQAALIKPAEFRSPGEREALVRWFVSVAPELAPEREKIEALRRTRPAYPTTLVLQERPPDNPRATLRRNRGEFLQPLEAVPAALPAVLAAGVTTPPRDRLEFARWLVSRENPLSARVTVNREWQAFFGRGLVRTMEDFGFQGALPSHPDLLDWLAVEFMEQGWSLKTLRKLIVMSGTYRQTSQVTPDRLEKDPENILLSRGPRFRVEGELLRDLALRAGGLLSAKIGGPSVFPPQLPSITKEGAYGPLEWKVSEGEDRYRRGLYTFAKRTAPYAAFQTFDGPSGEACVARREVSNTPLQALTLLNDEVFVEAAQALGHQATALDAPDRERARTIFRRCLTRPPTEAELDRVMAFHATQRGRLSRGELPAGDLAGPGEGDPIERAAWTAVARALLNLDETVTRG